MDEEVLQNFSPVDNIANMQESISKTREETFQEHQFEWVKTERSGDVCNFSNFEIENGVEYVNFSDGSRIRTEFIGDIVLMHKYSDEILGLRQEFEIPQPMTRSHTVDLSDAQILGISVPTSVVSSPASVEKTYEDPVVSILEKTKKRTEKISLSITVKIPSPELYTVIRENFENVDEILLENVMQQIQENSLRDALKKQLQSIYSLKKKKS
jgi:hypothetical protein